MPLCDICNSISFEDLPPFPEEEYQRTLTGLEYVQNLSRKRDVPCDETASSVRHHADIEGLRRAATQGCELCLMIQREADSMLAELENVEGVNKQYSKKPPTFNMWLTKRPDGGQGFWILSECSPGFWGTATVPIAAFGFTAAEDDPLASIFRGRPVKQCPDVQTLRHLVGWNSDCEHNHECCRGIGPLPKYLIDVQSSKSGETVKVVSLGSMTRHKYTALTYTSESGIVSYWEGNAVLENIYIRVADLPKTFQDAVVVTRALSVQYLWIDSLCIPRNWERDSEEANSIYANAYLTISATGSGNVTDGLLFPRLSPNSIQMPYRTSDGIAGIVSVSALPLAKEVIRSRYIEMQKEPISQGVWSFQERVLSPRIVHFASDQMYFECLRHFVSEDGLLERLRYHTAVENLPDGLDHYRKRGGKDGPLARWFSILWDYGQRHTNTPSDKFPGISNLARIFQRMLNDEYVAGYWKKSFIESLCWQSLSCKPALDRSAPSWSWASLDGIPAVGFKTTTPHLIATIGNTQVSLLDVAKPFGRVAAASIELEAPLVRLRLFAKLGKMYVRTDRGDEDGFYPVFDTIDNTASAELLRNTDLFALVLAKTHQGECAGGDCERGGTYHGLIVTPADALGNSMGRRGFFLTSSLSFGDGEMLSSRKSITLV